MPNPDSHPRSGAVRWLAVAAVLLVIAGIALWIVGTHLSPIVRERAVNALAQRYQAKVQLGDLNVSLFPRITVTGDNLELRKVERPSDPPMVSIRHFVGHTGFAALMGTPLHIHYIRLEGLKLNLPHKGSGEQVVPQANAPAKKGSQELIIDEIDADGTFLTILPKDAGKEPLEFEISKLNLRSVGKDLPMEFRTTLTNAKPPGSIQSTGHFGPWQSGEPGDSPVDGHYTFSNADLGVFKGISGILSSTGDYQGRLNQMEVKGTTDIPNFTVSTGGHPVHLVTNFQATVDGTDGNTYLHPVNAHFENTDVTCQGEVEHESGGAPGKTVALDAVINKGRVEDVIKLAVKGDPIMTGPIQIKAKLLLPPGKGIVMERLQLDGEFDVAAATFTRNQLQEKITDLSLRAQGRPKEAKETNVGPNAEAPESIASHLQARFGLKNGTATFPRLQFEVPGARLSLAGSYGLINEALDFRGTFSMEAKVSQAFTGWKSLLLKAADPFFSKNGQGTVVPLKITGTRKNPEFGVELFHHSSLSR